MYPTVQNVPEMSNRGYVCWVGRSVENRDVFRFLSLCAQPSNIASRALPCWKVSLGLRKKGITMGCRTLSWYGNAYMSIWIISSCEWCQWHIPPQTITPPAPWAIPKTTFKQSARHHDTTNKSVTRILRSPSNTCISTLMPWPDSSQVKASVCFSKVGASCVCKDSLVIQNKHFISCTSSWS